LALKRIITPTILVLILLSACTSGASLPRLIEPPEKFDYSALPGSIAYLNLECGDSFCTNLGMMLPDFSADQSLTVQTSGMVSDITWSPDGRYIGYSIFTLGATASFTQMWLYDLQDNTSSLLTPNTIDTPYSISWSPDNHFLLFATKNEEKSTWSLVVLDVESKAEFVMFEDSAKYTDISAAWSPAGDWIVFSAVDSEGSAQLWSAATDGSSLTALTKDEAFASLKPSWKPDGSALAYYRKDRQGKAELWTMGPTGENAEKLAGFGNNEILEKPVWSPDGHYLAAIHGNQVATEVLLIDLSTEKQMRLNKVEGKYSILSWAPDSSALIFMENRGSLDHWLNMFVFNDGKPFEVSAPVDFNYPVWSPAVYTP
jgi:Tol biopolymer transport system component